MQARLGLGERAGVDLAAGGQEDQEVDQLLIGVRHRRALDEGAVDQLEQDAVVADDDDVLDPVVVDQRLKPAEPEQGVEDRLSRRLLPNGAPRALAGIGSIGHRRLDQVKDDRAAELLLSIPVEPATVRGDRLAQLLGRLGTQRGDE